MARIITYEEIMTFTAGGTINEGRFVKVSGSNVVQAGADEAAIGVALSDASSGETLAVAVYGTVSVEAGATIAFGDTVYSDANGKATTSGTNNALGVAYGAATSGQLVPVRIKT